MKYLFSLLLFLAMTSGASAQSKIIRLQVDSDTIYFRYFYLSHIASDYFINDTVKLLGRKINEESFYLDKKVKNKTVWTRICSIQPASDSLSVTTRTHQHNGKNKLTQSRISYYYSILKEI